MTKFTSGFAIQNQKELMRGLKSVVAGAVMAFAGIAAMAGVPAQAATGPEYVALGDSYASALSSTTNFVTLTVGGNDARFATVAKACLAESHSYCRTATSWMS